MKHQPMSHAPLSHQRWFKQLLPSHQSLISQSYFLLDREKRLKAGFDDYSFIVFPCAKAYEGFLKWYLFELNVISEETYYGRKFRIGRSLNPDLPNRLRNEEWLFDELAHHCGDVLARQMWVAWLECRNHVFHYFPDQENHLSLLIVEEKLSMMMQVMERLTLCLGK